MTTVMEFKIGKGCTAEFTYDLSPQKALVNYIAQTIYKDNQWWTYPSIIDGMKHIRTNKDFWYYETPNGVIIAVEAKEKENN